MVQRRIYQNPPGNRLPGGNINETAIAIGIDSTAKAMLVISVIFTIFDRSCNPVSAINAIIIETIAGIVVNNAMMIVRKRAVLDCYIFYHKLDKAGFLSKFLFLLRTS
jgi:hypothetical protein